jgi:hypothetical protein
MSWTGAWPAKPEESPADRLPIANYATAYLAPLVQAASQHAELKKTLISMPQ